MFDAKQAGFHKGSNGDFHWLVTDNCIEDLLRALPRIVVGNYVAITALDSGPVRNLSKEERAAGWELRYEIAYSPKIISVDDLFWDNSFDEWFVFHSPVDLGRRVPDEVNIFQTPVAEGEVVPFVNLFLDLHQSPDEVLATLFWNQMGWIRPHAYIADSQSWLTIVSPDKLLLEQASQALAALNL